MICFTRVARLCFCAATAVVLTATAADTNANPRVQGVKSILEELTLFNPAAMERAIIHLAGKYPERFDQAKLLAELKSHAGQLAPTLAALTKKDLAAVAQAQAILDFKRRVLLSNPVLDFDQIVAVQRIRPGTENTADANCGQVGLAPNWLVNTDIPKKGWDSSIGIVSLTGDFTPVATSSNFMGDMSLHFDADKVLYSSIGTANNTWQIFELNLKDKSLRQVSLGTYADIDSFDPCYLPNGKIIYASTAGFQGVPCIGGNGDIANLHVMDSDGTHIRRLTFDQESNWSPFLPQFPRKCNYVGSVRPKTSMILRWMGLVSV